MTGFRWYLYDAMQSLGWLVPEGMFKATLLLVLAFALHLVLTQRFVLVRSAFWNACLVGLLVLPVAMLCLPRVSTGLSQDTIGTGLLTSKIAIPHECVALAPQPETNEHAVPASAAADARPDTAQQHSTHGFSETISVWLGTIYAVGLLVMLIRFGGSLAAVRRFTKSATLVGKSEWQLRVNRFARQLGIRRDVALCQSDDVSVPIVVGMTHPNILLPKDLVSQLSQTELDAILLHELAHVRRKDYGWLVILRLVQIVHWPNPLVWLAGMLISRDREVSCDVYCIHAMRSKERYTQSLAALAAMTSNRTWAAVGLAAVRPARIQRRLKAINDASPSPRCVASGKLRVASLGVVTTAAIGFGPLAAQDQNDSAARPSNVRSESPAHEEHQPWQGKQKFEGHRDFGDAEMRGIRDRTDLQVLLLPDTKVTDAGLEHVSGLANLENLVLNGTDVTDRGLAHLKTLVNLKSLALSGTKVTSAGMENLKDLKHLTELYLFDTDVTDDGLQHLESLTNLTMLNLARTKVTDAGLQHLRQMKKLRYLFLGFTSVSDAGLSNLAGLKDLRGVFLVRTDVSDKGLEHVKDWNKLETLWLSYTNTTDLGLVHLKGLTKLKHLNLSGTHVTDSGLTHLRGLSNLETLHLTLTLVGDEGLGHLSGLQKLRSLYAIQTAVNRAGIDKLRQGLPNLTIHGPGS